MALELLITLNLVAAIVSAVAAVHIARKNDVVLYIFLLALSYVSMFIVVSNIKELV